MQYFLISLLTFTLVYAQEDGEVVKNVTASQRTDGSKVIDIYYDLEDHENFHSYRIYVTYEDEGSDEKKFLNHCMGDVWSDVFPGNGKHIECHLTLETNQNSYISGNFNVNIHAESMSADETPDSFELVHITSDNFNHVVSYYNDENVNVCEVREFNVPYDFQIMKYEVTNAQYVQFLNDLINTAVEVNDWDSDPTDQSWQRYYTFENGRHMSLSYTEWESGVGSGQIQGYYPLYYCHWDYYGSGGDGFEYEYPQASENWLDLCSIESSTLSSPCIEFYGGSENNSATTFLISEGHGNHPVTLHYDGAVAFAEFYGMTLPTYEEWMISAAGPEILDNYYLHGQSLGGCTSGVLEDCFNTGEYSILQWISSFITGDYDFVDEEEASASWNYVFSNDPFEDDSGHGTTPVGWYNGINENTIDAQNYYGLYDIIGNVSEYISYSVNTWQHVPSYYSEGYPALPSCSCIMSHPSAGGSHGWHGFSFNYPYLYSSIMNNYTSYIDDSQLYEMDYPPRTGFRCIKR